MLTTVIIAAALLTWAIHLVERGWHQREEALMLAGGLVVLTAGAVFFVYFLLSRLFGL
ncbi:hypothetical protein [Gloeobacter kilaueensis]|uniref:Uncharacterized protein n=1 Tax=Gloeobacter kilaueensis (strain ATCC BAA-2537 / CCAP 1431/1 / ULC 316 / JS1) TaxID=1183438 RepID=U5QLK1_GLOK1|nr:hypothetical protein [Gloeobacter kilaueensis]AGY58484.1 hypothetical protein GKIL_2238 [Gloeobacter kilaueensis JS1]